MLKFKSKLTLWLSLLGALIVMLVPLRAHASVDDFTITDFKADYYLSKDDSQGELHVVENIQLFYTDFNHGILRSIPASYKGKPLKIKVNKISSTSGAPSQFTTYGQNGNMVLKIGDPNKTVTGLQSYTIDYTLRNVVSFYNDHDELYWDINGDEWRQPFEKITATVHLPQGLSVSQQACYAGGRGSTTKPCTIAANGSEITSATTRKLQPYETLTVVLAFPKGYFVAPTGLDWWKDNARQVLAVILPPLLIGGWAFRRWRKNGKDLKGRGVIIPEYGPPKGLSVAESAVINSYQLSSRAVSATIIDLAIRKYIRIIEVNQKKILKDKKTYEFELLNTDLSQLKEHETKILRDMFGNFTAGDKIDIDGLKKNKFYETIQSLQSGMPKDLTAAGYFPSNPKTAGAGMWVAVVFLIVVTFIFHNWLGLGFLLAAMIVALCAILMPRRTATGVEANEILKGLKLYMETAEKDRIAMLQSPDSNSSTEPVKTVELFEKLLPFAMILGVENEWAKQFENIYKSPPDWYSGNWSTFNALYLTSSLNNSVSALGTSFSAPSSSGSSGFSAGGGFSGGGGGGGGGGGW